MSRVSKYIAIGIAAATLIPMAANAQGLLGRVLQKSLRGRNEMADPRPPEVQSGTRTPAYLLDLRLKNGDWVLTFTPRDPRAYPSEAACQSNIGRDARDILDGYAVRPLAGKYLRPNALLVKDGTDPDAPEWKLALISCGQGAPAVRQPLDSLTVSHLASSGVDMQALEQEISDYIRQTDGSFPPPPTKADLAQAQMDKRWLRASARFLANGEMYTFGADEYSPFQTAEECRTATSKMLKATVAEQMGRATLSGESVMTFTDASGWVWVGCVSVRDKNSGTFTKFIDQRMTPARAKELKLVLTFQGK